MMNSTTKQTYGDPAVVSGGWQVALASIRGHRFAEGEGGAAPAGSGEGGNGDGTPSGDGAQGTPPATPEPPAAPTPATVAAQQSKQEMFSRDYVHELREEAKNNRIAHQEAQQRATTAEEQLAEAQAKLASLERENVVRAASKDIANADLLLDSSSFTQSLEQVDLADAEAVKAAITAFVEKNSAYGPTPSIPSSSGGTPSGGTTETPKTLEGAIAAHYQQ